MFSLLFLICLSYYYVLFLVFFFKFFSVVFFYFFFFQAEDGIRDLTVTGVQTCALPISRKPIRHRFPYFFSGGLIFPYFFSSQSRRCIWSSIVARRTCFRSSIRSGLGGAVFWSPSLQFVQTARRFSGLSKPPLDLSMMWPIVKRTFCPR